MADTKGVIYQGRTEGMNQWKSAHAANTKARTLIGYEPQCTLENIFDTALADEAGEPADVISA